VLEEDAVVVVVVVVKAVVVVVVKVEVGGSDGEMRRYGTMNETRSDGKIDGERPESWLLAWINQGQNRGKVRTAK
jgi:hypothetical protein